MADKSHGTAVGLDTADRLNELQSALGEMDRRVADISAAANTITSSSPVAEADMDPGYTYWWPDSNGDLVIGGLDSSTGSRTRIQTNVSVGSDGGLIGGIVGGLI